MVHAALLRKRASQGARRPVFSFLGKGRNVIHKLLLLTPVPSFPQLVDTFRQLQPPHDGVYHRLFEPALGGMSAAQEERRVWRTAKVLEDERVKASTRVRQLSSYLGRTS